MKERRSGHRTQWAAQFAVASELCKRGYEVAFTMGNHPSVDLMATSPGAVSFGVDVKGLYRRNWWLVRPKPLKPNLFFVFAYVPDDMHNRFFVLTQEEVNSEVATASEQARQKAEAAGKLSTFDDFPGIGWDAAEKYENHWRSLPQ